MTMIPAGVTTLLPLIEACDNFILPAGPWSAQDCRLRWQKHGGTKRQQAAKDEKQSMDHSDSAIDDTDDEVDDGEEGEESAHFDEEFIVPFFIDAPLVQRSSGGTDISSNAHLDSASPLSSAVRAAVVAGAPRRGSDIGTSSLRRLTPLASPRPSTPTIPGGSPATTFSGAARPTVTGRTDSHQKARDQPIGFLRPCVVQKLVEDNARMISIHCRPVWSFLPPQPGESYVPSTSRNASVMGSPSSSRAQSRRNSESRKVSLSNSGNATANDGLHKALHSLSSPSASTSKSVNVDPASQIYSVAFQPWVNDLGSSTRSEHMDRITRIWKETGVFADALGGWRNEEYSIFGPKRAEAAGPKDEEVAFRLERAACALFGLATFGVHLTAYVRDETSGEISVWVPRRSSTKQTWPSFLDNTVAGGITSGATPLASILRECAEEASFEIYEVESYVRKNIRSTGMVSYSYRSEGGWIQPEIQYIYDLELPAPTLLPSTSNARSTQLKQSSSEPSIDDDSILSSNSTDLAILQYSPTSLIPRPNPLDREVASFHLLSLSQCISLALQNQFKPNCALVLVDFAVRHGLVGFEDDEAFSEVCARMHSGLEGLPGMR